MKLFTYFHKFYYKRIACDYTNNPEVMQDCTLYYTAVPYNAGLYPTIQLYPILYSCTLYYTAVPYNAGLYPIMQDCTLNYTAVPYNAGLYLILYSCTL